MAGAYPLLILFDGACGLCQGSVRWLLRHDRRHALRFAPLDGPTAAPWRAAAGPALDTLVAVAPGPAGPRVLVRSVAALAALRALGGGWAGLAVGLRLVPRPLADAVYRYLSRNRHRLGATTCHRPGGEDGRFLP